MEEFSKYLDLLPLRRTDVTDAIFEKAIEIKATKALSVCDSWIIATAIAHNSILVHKDPEFEQGKKAVKLEAGPIGCPQKKRQKNEYLSTLRRWLSNSWVWGAWGMSYLVLPRSFGGLSKRKARVFAILGICFLFIASPSLADNWSHHYIQSLPDSAFSAVEIAKDGKKIRHLPHHDHTGEIDIGHLKSALGRIHQVKWVDPANFARAKEHLEQHYQLYKQK